MRAGFRQDNAQQSELERRRAELSELCRRHTVATEVLQQLLDGIEFFKRHCSSTVMSRLAELDRLEDEISRFSGNFRVAPPSSGATPSAGTPKESAPPVYDIKSTYRRIAKAVHPDLPGKNAGALDCNEMMLKANRAYAADDLRTLRGLLDKCRDAGLAEEDPAADPAAEVVRLERTIGIKRREVDEVLAQVALLRQGYAWRLKQRIESRTGEGDLMTELVHLADLSIAAALRRLDLLKGEKTRRLDFPEDYSCGTLFVRDRLSSNCSLWKELGEARGGIEIGEGKAVRLDIKGDAAIKILGLQRLLADDLHSLYLYQSSDDDLGGILHLTGVEELYLSGSRVTDAALIKISSLKKLRRLYIYQTAITDEGLPHLYDLPALCGVTSSGNLVTEEGLAKLRRAAPGVRTVIFQWKK